MTINGVSYVMPTFNFGTAAKLEKIGVSLANMQESPMSFIVGCVALAMGTDFDSAADALDKYVEDGGDVAVISREIAAACKNSSFFKRGANVSAR